MKAACFITSYGMGHATRACAVMQALHELEPQLEFEIYSKVPDWVFRHSLDLPYILHPLLTDIGLVQRTPLEEDLPMTLRQLRMLMPYQNELVARTAGQVHGLGCRFVLCDIAPLGILVARAAAIPSVLVENFRWDWIYAGYTREAPGLQVYIDYLAELFETVDLHIQTEPVCAPHPQARLLAAPISRKVRTPAEDLRRSLEIPAHKKIVLISSSPLPDVRHLCKQLNRLPGLFLLFSGEDEALVRYASALILPRSTYHPDLVNLSDAVVAKAGYSTLAETYHSGALYAYIPRQRFRESLVLGEFIEQRMGGFAITPDLDDTAWMDALAQRLDVYTPAPRRENGADEVARFILARACGPGS